MKERMGGFNSQEMAQPAPVFVLHSRQAAVIILSLPDQ